MSKILQQRFTLNTGYQLRHAAGQYVLLNVEQEGVPYQSPLVINAIGAEMWSMFFEGKKTEELVECLSREYDVPSVEIQRDMEEFLEQLAAQGAILWE